MPTAPPVGPLAGLRVIEFGDFITAPYCAKLMADLGAEVIKVERPGAGDESREFGPFPGDAPHPEKSGLYAYLNANKRSITLDLATATGAHLFRSLAAQADVLVENQQPGVMEASGLSFDALAGDNPRLVYTSISAFGRSGPYCGYKGHDLTAWHASGNGVVHLGYPDREPLRGAWYGADHWGAIGGATATLLALYARDVVGGGQHVDLSQADMMAGMILGYQKVTVYHKTGETARRTGFRGSQNAPSGLFRCKDGFVFLFAFENHHWDGLVRAMGDPEWAKDPIFKGPSWERAKYGNEINTLMKPWIDSHTKDEIFYACQSNRVPSGPVYTTAELLKHPHLHERGFFVEVDHPALGRVKMLGRPYIFSETPWAMRSPAPALGQDNAEVYGNHLGLSPGEIADLARAGVI